MMGERPDDIPQAVWDEAIEAIGVKGTPSFADPDRVSRAILAAKAEERRECLQAVADEQLSGDSDDDGDRAYMRAINDAAAAIRKRGVQP